MEQTRLRIKMVVPPEKVDFLVMEGKVSRIFIPSLSSAPFKMNMNFDNSKSPEDNDPRVEENFSLICEGEVWVEDIEGTGRRKKLGRFSAMKLETPPQGSYTYSIPPPLRLPDE